MEKEELTVRKSRYCLSVLAAALFTFVFSHLTAFADAIWEPSNDFYMENPQDCEYEGRDYQTNGKEGFVVVYEEPGKPEEAGRIKNGKRFYVGFTYRDRGGNVWGAVNLWGYEPEADEVLEDQVRDGWVLMENLARIYVGSDFLEEYEKDFSDYRGELDAYEIKEQLLFWEYPGSGRICGWIETYFNDGDTPAYQYLYTDQDNIRWAYVGYYYGEKGWVCVDEPENRELSLSYGSQTVDQDLYPPQKPQGEISLPAESFGGVGIKTALAAVASVMLVTALLIAVLFKRK